MHHSPLQGLKVVTAHEMARIEALAYAEGASEKLFMQKAGSGIADATERFLKSRGLPLVVTLLVGKGNNGGDAYAAGIHLLERKIPTRAVSLFSSDACTPLNQTMHEKFLSAGGTHLSLTEAFQAGSDLKGVILDGLTGTGFHGRAEGVLAQAITGANRSNLPILAIDIPSGLNGNTGDVGSVAIEAEQTLFLELPKAGFFLKKGWDHVGTLQYTSFGLSEKYISQAKPFAHLIDEKALSSSLPKIVRTRHKYQAGYLLGIAGSASMPGAALLASTAALRSGAGIVRLFHPLGMELLLTAAPYELIREGWDGKNTKRIKEESLRAKALFIGPGVGRKKQEQKRVFEILKKIALPMVIDADALFFLGENPSCKLPKGSILTPHRGEMEHLLSRFSHHQEKEFLSLCQAYADAKEVTIVLKGSPTWIFHPSSTPLLSLAGDPGMATAGSGDILTGMIGAMLAQGLSAQTAAALSTHLHGRAGEAAATTLTSYCLTASDLLDFLPAAFCEYSE